MQESAGRSKEASARSAPLGPQPVRETGPLCPSRLCGPSNMESIGTQRHRRDAKDTEGVGEEYSLDNSD